MGLWKLASIGILYFLSLNIHQANAQKKWDGEAGDGSWNSERNWFPDGVPDSSEAVTLDNTIITSSYTVTISSDTTTVKLHSLIIHPSNGISITMEIPKSNKAVPALSVFSNKLSITIAKAGLLINKSDAVAGNTILMNGKIRIEDGGRYSHQTQRGNAYIITKLVSSPGTEKGVVEFDIPGNASYPISISGRQYGSLWLNSGNKEKRIYTGSGNNDLMIRGDLIINDSVSFNSSLTGNIFLSGNINNKGILSIFPSTADSANRELIFNGDSSEYYSGGALLLNEHFNLMRLKKGVLYLKSSIQIDKSTSSFVVDSHARLMMDTFCVYGIGEFRTESDAIVGIASPEGISNNSSKGNIRSVQKNISQKTSFIFYGEQKQVTGSSFPSSIACLEINKKRGDLSLSSPLLINDSLILSRGIIRSSDSEPLELMGIAYSKEINQYGWPCGSDSSFIDGPLRMRSNKTLNRYFPIGKGQSFSPMKIQFADTINKTIEAEYIDAIKVSLNNILPPLKSVANNGYWRIKTIDDVDTTIQTMVVQLGIPPQQHSNLLNQPVVVIGDTVASTWKIIENSVYDQTNNTASGKISMKETILAVGSTQEEILLDKRIDLSYRKDDQLIILMWNMQGDIQFKNMLIEKSIDGIRYATSYQYTDRPRQINQHQYEKKIMPEAHRTTYFRIVCQDETDTKIMSNIICIKEQKRSDLPYPNPVYDEMSVGIPENQEKRAQDVQVIDMAGRIIPVDVSMNRNMVRINTSKLPKGLYRLIIPLGKEKKIYSFVRN
ncbi:MAG: T9SS type A sorting domain-containing protein [bacterium]